MRFYNWLLRLRRDDKHDEAIATLALSEQGTIARVDGSAILYSGPVAYQSCFLGILRICNGYHESGLE
jgi:hypothetical protein